MATKTVDVDEMMNTVLVCDVCMEPFDSAARVPLLLPCRHSFCVSCLESLSKGGDFRCPTCRHLVTVSGPVATSLPKDIISLKVVDYLAMKSAVQKVPCTDCVDKNTASCRCLTCHLNMCEVCQNGHRRVPFFRNHNIRTLGELAEAPVEFLTEAETCVEHVGVTLNLYCDSEACKVALCTSCAMVAHRQDSHSIMDLSKAHGRAKKEFAELLGLLEKEEEKQRGISDDVQKKMEVVQTSAAKSTDQVNQAMDRLLEAVEKRRKQLLEEVRQAKDRQKAELEKLQEETSSHVSQIQEATGYLRRAERLSRQAEFISVVHAQGPSVRKLAKSGLLADSGRAFLDNYPGLRDSITFEAGDVEKSVEAVLALGSVRDQWRLPIEFKQTKCCAEETKEEKKEEEEEEEERSVFDKRATLWCLVNKDWKKLGMGNLRILYDDDLNGHKVMMVADDGKKLCNHVICQEYTVSCMKKQGRCEWKAVDFLTDEPVWCTFRAVFSTPAAAMEFEVNFSEGIQLARSSDLSKLPVVDPEGGAGANP